MNVVKIAPRTVIGVFLGGMGLIVGVAFFTVFWNDARGPAAIGAAIAAAGLAILAAARHIEIDPRTRIVRIRTSWLFVSKTRELPFAGISGVAIARTPGSTPSYCVQLLANENVSLPTQGRDSKGARKRAHGIAEALGVAVEDDTRRVSSVPML